MFRAVCVRMTIHTMTGLFLWKTRRSFYVGSDYFDHIKLDNKADI